MALADDLRDLRAHSLAALDASHDYFTFSKRVWRLLKKDVTAGRRFSFRNPATRKAVNEQNLGDLGRPYVSDYLASFSFQHFVSLFEDFFFDLLRLWLTAYPGGLSRRQIEVAAVLQALDKNSIVQAIVDKELNEVKYKRIAEWFEYLDRLVHLGCPSAEEIEMLAEIKASRDILAHNKGVANGIYVAKGGSKARYREGERLEIPEDYHRASWQTIRMVVRGVSDAAIAKA